MDAPPSRVAQQFDFGTDPPERPRVPRREVPLSALIAQARQQAPKRPEKLLVVISPDIDEPTSERPKAPRRLWRRRTRR